MSGGVPLIPHTPSWRWQNMSYFLFFFYIHLAKTTDIRLLCKAIKGYWVIIKQHFKNNPSRNALDLFWAFVLGSRWGHQRFWLQFLEVSSFFPDKMYGELFHIDNDLYHSSTMLITIQQPPYNSTLNCQILAALRGRGLCTNRQWHIRKCPQCRHWSRVECVCTVLYNRTMGVRGVTKCSLTGLLRYKVSTLG